MNDQSDWFTEGRDGPLEPTGPHELPDDIVLFSAYGATLFAACQLQLVLGDIYAFSFEEPRHGSIPRVNEKVIEAFNATLGGAKDLALDFLPRELHVEVESAVHARNWIAHHLPGRTRSLQRSRESILLLCDRLAVARDFITGVIDRLLEHLKQLYMVAGFSRDAIEEHFKPWRELDDPIPVGARIPKKEEEIVAAWYSRFSAPGIRFYLQNDEGVIWQFVENGLADSMFETAGSTWLPWHLLTPHLPAKVNPRPRKARYRSSFNYDLDLSTGLRITFACGPSTNGAVEIEVVDANGFRIFPM